MVQLTHNPLNIFTLMKTSIPPFVLSILFMSLYFMPISVLAQTAPPAFPDLAQEDTSIEAITWMKTQGIVEGYPDGTFKSLNKINRAEFMKIVVESITDTPKGTNCFPDVKTDWFAKYVCAGKTMGLVSGYPDGTFQPANNINFAEASKIITNALELKTSTAITADGAWYEPFVQPLAERAAIPMSISDLDKPIARGEMAEIIWRVEEEQTDKDSLQLEELAGQPIQVASCDALKTLFMERREDGPVYGPFIMEESADDTENVAAEAPAPTTDASVKSYSEGGMGAGENTAYSQTNVQVQGVDEADIVKTDGTFIYTITSQRVRIVRADPEADLMQVATIDLPDNETTRFSPNEMFVDGNRLTIIGSLTNYRIYEKGGAEAMIWFPGFHQSRTGVFIYDITDKNNPDLLRQLEFDGNYNRSRKVDGTVYLVTNKYDFAYQTYDKNDLTEAAVQDALPRYYDSSTGTENVLADCEDIRYFPRERTLNYLTVAAIPTDTTGDVEREVFIGNSENIYASRDNLYVAATNYDETDYYFDSDNAKTVVYRFALSPGNIEYKGRGKVPGTILNQFSMDESDKHLRIATTQGWGEKSTNNLYVLNTTMSIVGSLNNLAPGERIYSTRFMGDRGYMVTFEQIDPLFVFDLSDPTAPRTLGELKIPGFSTYLHPYDENHLIGFGQETDDGTGPTRTQGFKMALFDVTNPAAPQQIDAEVIPNAYSELLYEHKALLFDRERNLVAFPVQIYNYSTREDAEPIDGDTTVIEENFEGAYAYTVDIETGFTLRGKFEHPKTVETYETTNTRCTINPITDEETCETETSEYSYTNGDAIRRLLYIGENLYSVSNKWIRAGNLQTTQEKALLELPEIE